MTQSNRVLLIAVALFPSLLLALGDHSWRRWTLFLAAATSIGLLLWHVRDREDLANLARHSIPVSPRAQNLEGLLLIAARSCLRCDEALKRTVKQETPGLPDLLESKRIFPEELNDWITDVELSQRIATYQRRHPNPTAEQLRYWTGIVQGRLGYILSELAADHARLSVCLAIK